MPRKDLHELMINILSWLRRNAPISLRAAAEHFGVPQDEMYGYVMFLSVSGVGENFGEMIDIHVDDDDSDLTIYVQDTLGLDRPLQFDSAEATCLVSGLTALQNLPVTAEFTPADVRSAIEKLVQVMPARPIRDCSWF